MRKSMQKVGFSLTEFWPSKVSFRDNFQYVDIAILGVD
jgi:hypothetical protein